MASGSSGRVTNSGSKEYGFASDDILSSYGNQEGSNGDHSDPSATTNPSTEFHKSRMAMSSVYPSATYSPPEESSYLHEVISTVENTTKKNTDNIMRFLEGISSRMSQLELYCYNLDKSIGEMRSDLVRDHEESESKLKGLEKHMQEVRRSIQILKDKQELADTHKELAKLQLVQKESSGVNTTPENEEKNSQPSSESRNNENPSDFPEQQLALALPHQIAPQPSIPAGPAEHQIPQIPPPPSSMPPHNMPPQVHQSHYMPPPQMQSINAPSQPRYLAPQPQVQDHSSLPPPSAQSPVPSYQQQWPHQKPMTTVQPTQHQVMQPHIRNPPPQMAYSTYIPSHPSQAGPEMAPHSMPMQISFEGSSLPSSAGLEAIPYGYSSSSRPIQPQPSTQNLNVSSYGPQQPGDGYVTSGPHQAPPPRSGYMVYDSEGGRMYHHHPPQTLHSHFQQNAYPPTNVPERIPSSNISVPQSLRGHPYSELIEKMMDMGYRADHVLGVIQRLEESGQPIDFNHVLDRLNGHSGGGSQRRG